MLQTLISLWRCKKNVSGGGPHFFLGGGGPLRKSPVSTCTNSKTPSSPRLGPTFGPLMFRSTCHTGNFATFTLRGLLSSQHKKVSDDAACQAPNCPISAGSIHHVMRSLSATKFTFRGLTKGGFVKGWFWRMSPRSVFRSGGTSAKTTLLENHPFVNP